MPSHSQSEAQVKRKKRSISDKERLDFILNWCEKHGNWLLGPEGEFSIQNRRKAIDAAIRAERASRKESK
jgi:hypothetical protein